MSAAVGGGVYSTPFRKSVLDLAIKVMNILVNFMYVYFKKG